MARRDLNAGVVRATRFELVDENSGSLRAMLATGPNGSVVLTLLDEDGQDVASVGFNLSYDETTELVLKGVDGGGKGLRLTVERDGRAGVRFLNVPSQLVSPDAPAGNVSPQVTIGMDENNMPLLMMVDPDGKPRAQIGVMPDGTAALVLCDQNGNPTRSLTAR